MAGSDEAYEEAKQKDSHDYHSQPHRKRTYDNPTRASTSKQTAKYENQSTRYPSWGEAQPSPVAFSYKSKRSALSRPDLGTGTGYSSVSKENESIHSPSDISQDAETSRRMIATVQQHPRTPGGFSFPSLIYDAIEGLGVHSLENNPFDLNSEASKLDRGGHPTLASYVEGTTGETVGESSTQLDILVKDLGKELQGIVDTEIRSPQVEEKLRSDASQDNGDAYMAKQEGNDSSMQRKEVKKPNMPNQSRIQHRHLQVDLDHARDDNARLQEKARKYRALAQEWRGEYSAFELRHDQSHTGLEDMIEDQILEMHFYIKEYHDKVNDPGYWNVEGLRKKNQDLAWDLETTSKLFESVKLEKARLEDEFNKLSNINTYYEGYIEKCMGDGRFMPPFSIPGSSSSHSSTDSYTDSWTLSGFSSPALESHKSPHIPRCLEEKECRNREAKLEKIREEQRRRRVETRNKEGKIMERVRRWNLGEMMIPYPPDMDGFERLAGKNSWEIWDGEEWYEDGQQVGDEDMVAIRNLRNHGKGNVKIAS
ncbi:hypothetical protein GQ44DRAFT_822765 [Phaeosphaeriaceae sp. PMI808]|nr:hypothetical protein GQ44DRAFT_822765 [Phaeosphaeriaceae sp. PMI808]